MSSLLEGPTDPSDWSFGPLRELDALLRCSICFEYFRTAMTLPSCSHTYCSLCIKRFLLVRPQCPTCSAPAKEGQLINNRPLDELVETFMKSRKDFMSALDHTHLSDRGDTVTHDNQLTSHDNQLTSRLTQSPETMQKRTARVPRPSKGTATTVTPSSARIPLPPSHIPISLMEGSPGGTLVEEEGGAAVSAGQAKGTRNHDDNDDWLMTSSASRPIVICDDGIGEEDIVMVTADSNNTAHSSRNEPLSACNVKERVKCPICGASFTEAQINAHLDRCLETSGRNTSCNGETQSLVQKKHKKLPKIVWNLLKDRELKKWLKDYHLPTTGRRHDMIQRLQEFSLRYNAQCDSQNPRTVEQVAGDMVKDDLARQSVSVPPADNMQVPKGCSDQEIDLLRRKYEVRHKDHFNQLAQELRKRSDPTPSSPPSPSTPPISSNMTTSSTTPTPVAAATQPSKGGPPPSFGDGEEAASTSFEAADCRTNVPESPYKAWKTRPRVSMSKKRTLSHSLLYDATSSDENVLDDDSNDKDFVEARTTTKRWKQ